MHRFQHKIIINSSQCNISPLQPRNPNRSGPEYRNIPEEQEKDLKAAFIIMIEVLKDEMNKCFKEIIKTQGVEENK